MIVHCPKCGKEIRKTGDGKIYHHLDTNCRYGKDMVPCEICGNDTPMTRIKRCDRCWELEKRIQADLFLSLVIITNLVKEKEEQI